MLCLTCKTLRESIDLSQNQELVLHPTISSLHSSSETGCHLCRMIYTNFCLKYQSELVSKSCRTLVKSVKNSGFWVSFESVQSEKSLVDMKGFDVAIVIGRLTIPGKLKCDSVPLLV
jgi:hypothetical protein